MLKNKKKYLTSIFIGIVLLTVFTGYMLHLKNTNVNADEADKIDVVSRGVVDNYVQLPKAKREGTTDADVGTEENPFLILEIVPCNEFAEVGYLISGCEPVKVEEMYGRGALKTIESATGAKVTQSTCYFFPDEKEANPDNYDGGNCSPYWADITLKGYYEKVDEGEGYFSQDSEGNIKKVGENKGNIIWHTVNDFEKDNYKNISFDDDKTILKNKGDRIYTKRESKSSYTEGSARITYSYYNYENRDYYLTDTLGLSKKEADDFSVVVKTITPEELNQNTAWISCSNLIYVNPKTHFGNDLINIWKNDKYRRTTKAPSNSGSDYTNKQTFAGNDISWEAAEKIYKKVTANIDYAGIIVDVKAHDDSAYVKRNIELQVYDQNLKKLEINNGGKKYKTIERNACDNNVYKLCVMLYCMDSRLFNKLYFDKDNPVIKDGIDTLQTGDAAKYWCSETFLLFDTEKTKYKHFNDYYYDWSVEQYWKSEDAWDKFKTHLEFSDYRPWVRDHIYVYNSDNSLPQCYMSKGNASNPDENKFDGYKDSVEDYKNEHGYGDDYKPTPSNAVRYILGIQPKLEKESVKVLDIEPSVGLKKKASSSDINKVDYDYKLTEQDVRGMLSNNILSKYNGNIEITHMTTAEFIGRTEDLNSTYDMIYMGLDDGAYNKDSNGKTVWNDKRLNGKVYFHTGDKLTSSEKNISIKGVTEKRSVKYLWSKIKNEPVDSLELRYPGNDITRIKEKELKDYVKSGRPIVMTGSLYNNDEELIDQYSNISDFIKTDFEKEYGVKGIYEESDSNGIVKAINSNGSVSVDFLQTPKKYNGDTGSGADSTKIVSPNYLDKDENGKTILPFKFTITYNKPENAEQNDNSVKYAYKIYVDKNQDSKFRENEVVYSSATEPVTVKSGKSVDISNENLRLGREYVGIINWKIEVYDVDNPSIRFLKTACSAASKSSEADKKAVKVLQIMPCQEHINKAKSGVNDTGELNLKESQIFKKYYQNLEDYSISIDTMTVEEFEDIFKNYYQQNGISFSFDNSQDISFDVGKENPKNYDVSDEDNLIKNNLKNYNMLIFGFGDMYCLENISNDYGAVDYIKYFIAQKKSVLFTHDITSLNNVGADVYGYTANALLRDVMGMNRYAALGNPDKTALTEDDKNILERYQAQRDYDDVKDTSGNVLEANHGYSYIALRRLGWQANNSEKVPYRYMITGVDGRPIYSKNTSNSEYRGFTNDNDRTEKIGKLNEGQITSYPYHIDKDEFKVSLTHGQYYQLNMEDPEVTVWYTLIDDGVNRISNTTQSAHVYAVSPYDAANNYYIYSKGNVFYSSVGHTTVNKDIEAKLFVNTMIAAYRASYQSPYVEVENADYADEYDKVYQISSEEEYKKKSDGNIRVYFRPTEDNLLSSEFTCSIYYPGQDGTEKGCEYITSDKIFKKDTGECISDTSSGTKEYTLYRDHVYYFDYPKSYLNEPEHSKIIFKVSSKAVSEPGYSTLNMVKKCMFELD